MCGICGIINAHHSRESDAFHVRAMMESLAHRGPDGEGIHEGSRAVLGHRRLAIIDLEHGQQPMLSRNGRYVLVFNGEIYNYVELRQQLIQRGSSFQTTSDTEVLLEMLIRHGEAALPQLNGMFGFCFLDTQTGEWLMARDPFGIKPLYYTVTAGEQLCFASEIKALLLHPDVSAQYDLGGLQQFFTFQFCLSSKTLFQDIHKVEPGFFLKGHGATIKQVKQYWDCSFNVDTHHTEAYFIDRLQFLLQDSMRLQIRSDVPLGVHLSGGIDSSLVATLTSGIVPPNMPVFTGKFLESPAYDESAFAKLVAENFGASFHEIVPTMDEFIECLPRLIYHMDEPMAGPGLFPQYIVNRYASQHVKVVLGGQGGDEFFGGYARYLVAYLEQALKGAIFETQEEGRYLVTLDSIIPNLPILKQYVPMLKKFWSEGLFESMDRRYFRIIDRTPDLESLLSKDFQAIVSKQDVFDAFQKQFNDPNTKSYINKMTHFDLKTLLPALLHVEDRVSMAVSLESRVPILDPRIAELAASVPPRIKFQGGKTKALLKKAMENVLPPEILNRKDKMGFPVPLSEWMDIPRFREFVHETLLSRRCIERGFFREQALYNMVAEEPQFGRQLWGLLCLELWFRQFIDRN